MCTCTNVHPGGIWTNSGHPPLVKVYFTFLTFFSTFFLVKVFRSDGQPTVATSLLINLRVACVLLHHFNGFNFCF
jgi:hypothetical protein